MAIERKTEGTLILKPAPGRGNHPTAKVSWVVGSGKMVLLQDDSRVELTAEQFKELMENSVPIYDDMRQGQK